MIVKVAHIRKQKGGAEMDNGNFDFVLNIFKTLSGELPDQLLYREDGDSCELKTLDGIGGHCLPDMQNDGWSLVGCRVA